LLHLQKRPFAQEAAEAEGKTAETIGNVKAAEAELEHYAIAADPRSGLVPVVVRLPNPDGRLRCCVPVKVRFR
jgi:hypothetical protein